LWDLLPFTLFHFPGESCTTLTQSLYVLHLRLPRTTGQGFQTASEYNALHLVHIPRQTQELQLLAHRLEQRVP